MAVCWCPFPLCRRAGTMPKYLCGCGVFVGSSEQAKRGHLKSAKHKQWVQGKKSQRSLNFPKVTPVQPTEASTASSSSNSNNPTQSNNVAQSGNSAQSKSAAQSNSAAQSGCPEQRSSAAQQDSCIEHQSCRGPGARL